MTAAAVPRHIARRAVEWMVELQAEPLSDTVRREWEQWRRSHPDHERAWERIEALNDRLRALGGEQQTAVATALLTPRGSAGRRQAVKALSALIFTGGLAWTAEEHLPWRAWSADQRTDTGQRRAIALADGSRVAINSGSAFNVEFDGAARRIHLLAGEILVSTVADRLRRPFLVHTAQGTIAALGTRFAVRLYQQATQVSVFDGAVELRPQRGTPPALLRAGQQAMFGSGAIMPTLAADEDNVAWTDGFLIAKGLHLGAFLAELGRYSQVPLACASQVADLRVSGSYRLDDIARVLETLAAALGLEVETTTRFLGRYRSGIRLIPRAVA